MHLGDAFIQSDLQLHSGYTFIISICVPWESNPQPFALQMQCSTTEPHRNTLPTPTFLKAQNNNLDFFFNVVFKLKYYSTVCFFISWTSPKMLFLAWFY